MSPFQLDPVYKYLQSIYSSVLTGIVAIVAFSSPYLVLHVSDTSPCPLVFDVSFGFPLSVSRLSHTRVPTVQAAFLTLSLCFVPWTPAIETKYSGRIFFYPPTLLWPYSFHCGRVCLRKCILALNSPPFVYSSVSQTSLAGRRWSVYCFFPAISV